MTISVSYNIAPKRRKGPAETGPSLKEESLMKYSCGFLLPRRADGDPSH
jgi:hypothetical protein